MSITLCFKISGPGGTDFSLNLAPSTTIAQVKILAKHKCGIPPDVMKIVCKGRIPKNEETLEALKVETGSTMRLVKSAASTTAAPALDALAASGAAPAPAAASPHMDAMPISVSFKVSGGSNFSLDLLKSNTIGQVKNLAEDRCGIAPEAMKLIFEGCSLKNEDTLESLKVEAACIIHLVKSGQVAGVPPVMCTMMSNPAMRQQMMKMVDGDAGWGSDGADGAGSLPGFIDPGVIGEMLQNPMGRQMMQNLSKDPVLLQNMIQNNPMLKELAKQDQSLEQRMADPQCHLALMFRPKELQKSLEEAAVLERRLPGATERYAASRRGPRGYLGGEALCLEEQEHPAWDIWSGPSRQMFDGARLIYHLHNISLVGICVRAILVHHLQHEQV